MVHKATSDSLDQQVAEAAPSREFVAFLRSYDHLTGIAQVSTAQSGGMTIPVTVSAHVRATPALLAPSARVVITKMLGHPTVLTDVLSLTVVTAQVQVAPRTTTMETPVLVTGKAFEPLEPYSLQVFDPQNTLIPWFARNPDGVHVDPSLTRLVGTIRADGSLSVTFSPGVDLNPGQLLGTYTIVVSGEVSKLQARTTYLMTLAPNSQ